MHIFSHFWLNPAGRTDVVGGPHAARGPQVARDWSDVSPFQKVRIPGNWSEFLHDSTNKVELLQYLSREVTQRFHSGGSMSNGTTVGHVGPGEDNRVQPGGSRHTDHPSHHSCSELWILQHSGQDFL